VKVCTMEQGIATLVIRSHGKLYICTWSTSPVSPDPVRLADPLPLTFTPSAQIQPLDRWALKVRLALEPLEYAILDLPANCSHELTNQSWLLNHGPVQIPAGSQPRRIDPRFELLD
jgi:hypothetical protein